MDALIVGRQGLYDEETLVDLGFNEKRLALVRHYTIALSKGRVEKMRIMADVIAEVRRAEEDEEEGRDGDE